MDSWILHSVEDDDQTEAAVSIVRVVQPLN